MEREGDRAYRQQVRDLKKDIRDDRRVYEDPDEALDSVQKVRDAEQDSNDKRKQLHQLRHERHPHLVPAHTTDDWRVWRNQPTILVNHWNDEHAEDEYEHVDPDISLERLIQWHNEAHDYSGAALKHKHGSVLHTAPGGGIHAPYRIQPTDDGKYKVVNDLGETKGIHDTKAQAREQQKALYVNVPGASEMAERKSGEKLRDLEGLASSARTPTVRDASHDYITTSDEYDSDGSPTKWYCSCGQSFGSYDAVKSHQSENKSRVQDLAYDPFRSATRFAYRDPVTGDPVPSKGLQDSVTGDPVGIAPSWVTDGGETQDCYACDGRGHRHGEECSVCDGKGRIPKEKVDWGEPVRISSLTRPDWYDTLDGATALTPAAFDPSEERVHPTPGTEGMGEGDDSADGGDGGSGGDD